MIPSAEYINCIECSVGGMIFEYIKSDIINGKVIIGKNCLFDKYPIIPKPIGSNPKIAKQVVVPYFGSNQNPVRIAEVIPPMLDNMNSIPVSFPVSEILLESCLTVIGMTHPSRVSGINKTVAVNNNEPGIVSIPIQNRWDLLISVGNISNRTPVAIQIGFKMLRFSFFDICPPIK
jgi:hypothetical protein